MGTKRQKNAPIVESCGLGCTHERFARTFYELEHLAMITFARNGRLSTTARRDRRIFMVIVDA